MRTPTLRHVVLSAAIFVAGLASCTPGFGEEPLAPDARRDSAPELWQPTCAGGADARRCGLLTDQFNAAWAEKFVREACQQDPKQDLTDECRAAMHKSIVGALSRRYLRATTSEVSEECGRRAGEGYCENFVNLERVYLATHNRAVLAEVERQQEARAAAESPRPALSMIGRPETSGAPAPIGAHRAVSAPEAQRSRGFDNANGECSSDFDCSGGLGMRCAKGAGKSTGTCAKTVDASGAPAHGPRGGTGGLGARQCFSAFDCAPGFKCDDGRCMR